MPEPAPAHQRLLAELKRRHVFRVAAAYGVIGFGVIEAAQAIFPRVGLPDWTITLVVWLTLLGFPVALLLAWALETSPAGVKRTEDASRAEIEAILAQPSSRRWTAGLLALAGAALLFGGWWMGRSAGTGSALPSLVGADASSGDVWRIAVLPFESFGGNEENDPFLAGLHLDIYEKLKRLDRLQVTALGSANEFRDPAQTASEIAAALGVDYLVRGTVRRAGEQVRVDVRLVDVRRNQDAWIQQYDHAVTAENLFATQTRIATEVAGRLESDLSPRDLEKLRATLSSNDLEAINAYHRALSQRLSPTSWATWHQEMLDAAERAVELDPDFAEAWELVAEGRALASQAAVFSVTDSAAATVRAAIERVEALAPGSLEAFRARGLYAYSVEDDRQGAIDIYERAEKLAPSDPQVNQALSALHQESGEFEEALGYAKRWAAVNPRDPSAIAFLGIPLTRLAMWDAADLAAERALALEPDHMLARTIKFVVLFNGQGDPGAARTFVAESGLEEHDPTWYALLAQAAVWERDYDAAHDFLTRTGRSDSPYREVYLFIGFSWIEQLRSGTTATYADSIAAVLDEHPEFDVGHQFSLVEALILGGREHEGWELIERHLEEASESGDPIGAVSRAREAAWIYARFGRTDDAIEALEGTIGRPGMVPWSVADLRLDPVYDSMRDVPRFQELVERQADYERRQAIRAEEEGPWLP